MAGENDTWEFYKDKKGEWRWRRFATNGQNVGSSAEGYVSKADCKANAARAPYVEGKSKEKDA
jgi:uncharacterized protein YegP (UPF0339 family)